MSVLENRIFEWLDKPVWWAMEHVPRKIVLHRFVKEGLIPFVESHGYTFGINLSEVYTYIARGMYVNYYHSTFKSVWTDTPYNTEHALEDRIHFDDMIDCKAWTEFWSTWTHWSDVDPNFYRGRDRQIDIEEFVWRQLDLDNSPQTEVLYYRMHQELDDDMADERRGDVYLEEAVGWGGYRK